MLGWQLLLNGIVVGAQYALVAVGFSIIFSITRIFHVAQGATYVLAGFACYEVSQRLHAGLLLGIVAALFVAAAFGFIMQEGLYRSITNAEHSLFAMFVASFGAVIVVDNVISWAFGDNTINVVPALTKTLNIGQLQITKGGLVGLGLTIVVIGGLGLLLHRTRVGTLLRALASDEELFEMTYGSSRKYRRIAFALGSILVVPGVLMIGSIQGLQSSDGITIGTILIAVTIVGGIGSLTGAALGGLAVGIVENLAQWKLSVGWDPVVTYGIIVVLMLARPTGLLRALRPAQ
jgi:branched-chain amino acid transport system permease protein